MRSRLAMSSRCASRSALRKIEQYLQIEDPIPAGFELIEQEGLYELKVKPSWWDFYYTQREFHDDRVALFSPPNSSADRDSSIIFLKAVTPGTFQANPARVLPICRPAQQWDPF